MKKIKVIFIVALLCAVAQGAWADTWSGDDGATRPPIFYREGSAWSDEFGVNEPFKNKFVIMNAGQMAYVWKRFNEEAWMPSPTEENEWVKKHWYEMDFVLGCDLDMGDADLWTPMGGEGDFPLREFTGTFDGGWHTIRIHTAGATSNYQGLFARIGASGKVKNLRVDGIVQCDNSRLVGGIAGENLGTIENCWVRADVSSNWKNSSSFATAKVGGIAGENSGTIKNCVVSGNVTNNDADVGGIVGYHKQGTISHCAFYGTRNSTHSQDNIYIGSQKGSVDNLHSEFTDAALATYLESLPTTNDIKVYRKAVAEAFPITVNNETQGALEATRTGACPGLSVSLVPAPENRLLHLLVKDTKGNLMTERYGSITKDFTFTMPRCGIVVTTEDNDAWAGSGTEEDPYLISTPDEWNKINTLMMAAESDDAFQDTYFKQTDDFMPAMGIGAMGTSHNKSFCGTYDGDGHELHSSIIVNNGAAAPFYCVNGATIKNLSVSGVIEGGIHTAGLVAFTKGNVSIDNIHVSANITCSGSSTNDAHGGGIVGHAGESTLTVKRSLFDGYVKTTYNGLGDVRVGAIVGWGGKDVTVEDCMEKGSYGGAELLSAFCWKDDAKYAPTKSSSNYYFTNLTHSDGAGKLFTVTSGTEGVTLDLSRYTWEGIYNNAMQKSTNLLNDIYMIGNTCYIGNGYSAYFNLNCPENKTPKAVYANGTAITLESNGYYAVKNISSNVSITATLSSIFWDGDGTEASPYIVGNLEKFVKMQKVMNGSDAADVKGKYFRQTANIEFDKTAANNFTPVNTLNAHYDGNGYMISGLNMERTGADDAALFLNMADGCTVKNVIVKNSAFTGSSAAAIVKTLSGSASVENCHVLKDVTVRSNNFSAGGIAAYMQSGAPSVKGCSSQATVISNQSNAGGVVGSVYAGSVANCIYLGNNIQHGKGLYYSYAIAGGNDGATVENCYFTDASLTDYKAKLMPQYNKDVDNTGFLTALVARDKFLTNVSGLTKEQIGYGMTMNNRATLAAVQNADGTWQSKAYVVCLPFEVDLMKQLGLELETYAQKVTAFRPHRIDLDKKELIFTNCLPVLHAGDAYIVVVKNGSVALSADNVTVVATPAEPDKIMSLADENKQIGWWKGTFKRIDNAQMTEENIYIAQSTGKFRCPPKGYTTAYVNPFVGYFSALEPLDKDRYTIKYVYTGQGDGDDDDETGIVEDFPADAFDSEFDMDDITDVKSVQGTRYKIQDGASYNLSGQKVTEGYKGIIIKNGKKIVINN